MIFFACKKSNVTTVAETNTFQEEIKVDDGILVFSNFDAFTKTLQEQNSSNDTEKDAWEKKLGFTSFRTKFNEISDQLSRIKTMEEANSIIKRNKNIVSLNGDEIKPSLVNRKFASLVNPEGIVRVGNDFYRFSNDKETIVLNGSRERLIAASVSDNERLGKDIFQFTIGNNSELIPTGRYTCSAGILSSCQTSTSTKKAFFRLEYSNYVGINRDPVTYLPVSITKTAAVDLHFSAQQKIGIFWNSYATNYVYSVNYVDDLGHNIHINNFNTISTYKDWWYNLSYVSRTYPYGTTDASVICSPNISTFNCTGTSGGTSPNNCTFTY